MESVLIAGGTGFIGKKIANILIQNGYEVRILSRKKNLANPNNSFVWDVEKSQIDLHAFKDIDHIINLSGANIGEKRWTKNRKELILNSRIDSTKLLFDYIKKLQIPLKTFVSASAVGYYGSIISEQILSESNPFIDDFLGNVCHQWEQEALKFNELNIRTTIIRTGIVFAKNEGAFQKIVQPIKLGFGAVLGSGKQYLPWIHEDDIAQIYVNAISNKDWNGIINAVAPQHINNRELTHKIAEKLGKKIFLASIPSFILQLILGEMSQLVLTGSRVSSEKLKEIGYKFHFETIDKTLDDLL